jgi:type I restriction enzyme M protein
MDVDEYFSREVLPLVADAWIDHSKTRIGFEVPFTRQFYKYAAPRDLNIIDSDLASITHQIIAMLNEVKG